MLHNLVSSASDRTVNRRNGRREAPKKRRNKRLAVQHLEARHLLAGDVGAVLDDIGTLTVTGDDANNAIRVDSVQRAKQDSTAVTGGLTSVFLDADILSAVNLAILGVSDDVQEPAEGFGDGVGFPINDATTFEFTTDGGFAPLGGTIEHDGTLTLGVVDTTIELVVGEFSIGFDPERAGNEFPSGDEVNVTSGFFVEDTQDLGIILFDVGTPGSLELDDSSLSIGDADLLVSPEFA